MSSVGEKMTEDVFSLGTGMGGHGMQYTPERPQSLYMWIPESSKGLKFEPLNHQKQTWGLKFDTLGGSRYIAAAYHVH